MSKVTAIYTRTPNAETISYLEQLLIQAKEGKLQTIAATGLLLDNTVVSCISNPQQPFLLLGAVENLKYRVNGLIEQ